MREEFKACSNCKHFKKHYIKGKSDYYVATGCGACDIKVFSEDERTKLPYDYFCESWRHSESGNCNLEEIKTELFDISVRIKSVLNKIIKMT